MQLPDQTGPQHQLEIPESVIRARGLCLFLFGPLRAYVNGTEVIGESYTRRKVKALLAYLYLRRGEYILKDELLEALWPEVDHVVSASGRLKQTILVLRTTLEGHRAPHGGWHYILERGGSYLFNTHVAYYSDLEDFEKTLTLAAAAQQRGATSEALRLFQHARELYRADVLQDFRYEDWAAEPAAELRERHLQTLEHAARLHAAQGDFTTAIQLLRPAVRQEPLRESTAMQLMDCLWRRGEHAEAVRVYLRLQATLERRLQLAPQPEATALYEAIRRDRAVRRADEPGRLPAAS
jgi:DNA-binding SARP family transcriptional activator